MSEPFATPTSPLETTATPTPSSNTRAPRIGVLAVQGAFIEHEQRLQQLGCNTVQLRQAADLTQPFDALVLPGGESTVQSKLIHELGMFDTLHSLIEDGMPVLGTCAGLILLARSVEGGRDEEGFDAQLVAQRSRVDGFRTLDVRVQRNAYGRQLGSFYTTAPLLDTASHIPMTFIRAPYIVEAGPRVKVLARVDGRIVAVQQDRQIGLSFHPELNTDNTIYRMFLDLIE